MIIIDSELKRRAAAGKPVRVGIIGAGFMARGIANTIVNSVPGLHLAAIANRTITNAQAVYTDAGVKEPLVARNLSELNQALAAKRPVVTEDPLLLCQADGLEVLLDLTGAIELGARLTMAAIAHGKHMVTNAELNATVGPILKVYADRAGVIVSGCDGDQPAVQMNLYRFVKGIGMTPLVCGNIKGMQDRYRTPTTQAAFAQRAGLSPKMATAFADGTKISLEQAEVANATGMKVAKRGMLGYTHAGPVDEMTKMYNLDELQRLGGIVEYTLATLPSPGVFVFASQADPKQRSMLTYCKLGDGPIYSFYVPYHLMTLEAHLTLARIALFKDAAIVPLGAPVVDVVTTAKRHLKAGELLDGVGEYTAYGLCENADVVRAENLLPIGLADGCRLKRDIAIDQAIRWADVEAPKDSLVHKLRQEQDAFFGERPPCSSPSIAASF